jgi:predicted component of viral defense system (DUF524 family)
VSYVPPLQAILFNLPSGESAAVSLYALSEGHINNPAITATLDSNGQSRVSLLEGFEYEYEVDTEGLRLDLPWDNNAGFIKRSLIASSTDRGLIRPGLFVGTLALVLRNATGTAASSTSIEIRSRKLSYEHDYRTMLSDIASKCLDLLLNTQSPVTIGLTHEISDNEATVAQQFAFMESILESDVFKQSLNQIFLFPHKKRVSVEEKQRASKPAKPSAKLIKDLTRQTRRIPVPTNSSLLSSGIEHLPEYLSHSRKIETLDTSENRFIKFALQEFSSFIRRIQLKISDAPASNLSVLQDRVNLMIQKIDQILSEEFFRTISQLNFLPLSSPVLQRKSGYREILRDWLMFELAANISWDRGENVFQAGKRDVASLYEYWVFFQLLDVVQSLCGIPDTDIEDLLVSTSDGIGLKLRAGRAWSLTGTITTGQRSFHLRFSYNRTYSNTSPGESSHPRAGSWTVLMRPDYSISIWPLGLSESDAEETERMLHLHFDAKYRIDNIEEYFGLGADEESLEKEKQESVMGKYKRGDILKMHSYKDAIRRSYGAFVVYPGNAEKKWRELYSIIPGIGAFPLRPQEEKSETGEIEAFFQQTIQLLDGPEYSHWFEGA